MTVYQPTEEELAAWHKACLDGTYDYVVNQIGKETVDNFLAIVDSLK